MKKPNFFEMKAYFTKLVLIFLAGYLFLFSSESFAQRQLWGMTPAGVAYNAGTIFMTDSSGNNQTVLHNFFQYEGK